MEVPVSYVKANQIGIVLFVAAALALQQPWILLFLWAVQTAGLFTGGRWNLFVWAANRIVGAGGPDTQSFELTRFNNTLAVLFLTLSLICYLFGWNVAGASPCGTWRTNPSSNTRKDIRSAKSTRRSAGRRASGATLSAKWKNLPRWTN